MKRVVRISSPQNVILRLCEESLLLKNHAIERSFALLRPVLERSEGMTKCMKLRTTENIIENMLRESEGRKPRNVPHLEKEKEIRCNSKIKSQSSQVEGAA